MLINFPSVPNSHNTTFPTLHSGFWRWQHVCSMVQVYMTQHFPCFCAGFGRWLTHSQVWNYKESWVALAAQRSRTLRVTWNCQMARFCQGQSGATFCCGTEGSSKWRLLAEVASHVTRAPSCRSCWMRGSWWLLALMDTLGWEFVLMDASARELVLMNISSYGIITNGNLGHLSIYLSIYLSINFPTLFLNWFFYFNQ